MEPFILRLLTKRLIPSRCHFSCMMGNQSRWNDDYDMVRSDCLWRRLCRDRERHQRIRFALGKPFSHPLYDESMSQLVACVRTCNVFRFYCLWCSTRNEGEFVLPKVYFYLPTATALLDKSVNSCMLNLIQPLYAYLWRENKYTEWERHESGACHGDIDIFGVLWIRFFPPSLSSSSTCVVHVYFLWLSMARWGLIPAACYTQTHIRTPKQRERRLRRPFNWTICENNLQIIVSHLGCGMSEAKWSDSWFYCLQSTHSHTTHRGLRGHSARRITCYPLLCVCR